MRWDPRPRDPQQQRGFDRIGVMVKRRRMALGWTQRVLEGRSGIDQTVISRIENGKQYGMRWSRFADLVEALGGLDVGQRSRSWPPARAYETDEGGLSAMDGLPDPAGRPPKRILVIDLSGGLDASEDNE
jgi:transcriptional regulator with XRE-family HTH domain